MNLVKGLFKLENYYIQLSNSSPSDFNFLESF
jgi:hypothetical protein